MLLLTHEQTATLQSWFLPERPGPLIGPHVIQTGQGNCWVDRWPDPRVVLVETAGNYTLLGDAEALSAAELHPYIEGFVEADAACVPLLKEAFPNAKAWPRIISSQEQAPNVDMAEQAAGVSLRRLEADDVQALWSLSPESAWISKTWGGPRGMVESGMAYGAFVDNELASVACTFFVGETYEEIGVITEPQFRGRGLSPACVNALCSDIRARGRQPSWTTSTDNIASIRVAEKLGFTFQRHDQLYVVGISIPASAVTEE